jgi:KipI family sensor histidine kinase inhibitor
MSRDLAAPMLWRQYGQHGILVEFSSANETMRAYQQCRHRGFDECVPGAQTIYIESRNAGGAALAAQVESILRQPFNPADTQPTRTHSISVTYDGEDLANVAALAGFSIEEVIHRHSGTTYTVAFLGFSRSFPYLSGLDPALQVPRLETPRISVPAGSVGMGAGFTGIYPMSSPGGWQLLGRTDAVLFDSSNDPPSVLTPGDQVKFVRM